LSLLSAWIFRRGWPFAASGPHFGFRSGSPFSSSCGGAYAGGPASLSHPSLPLLRVSAFMSSLCCADGFLLLPSASHLAVPCRTLFFQFFFIALAVHRLEHSAHPFSSFLFSFFFTFLFICSPLGSYRWLVHLHSLPVFTDHLVYFPCALSVPQLRRFPILPLYSILSSGHIYLRSGICGLVTPSFLVFRSSHRLALFHCV